MLLEILLRKNFWIRFFPRFSVPRWNLENSPNTPPFCFTTEFEENVQRLFFPGRSNISRPLISFRMVQYTFEKCAENAFQRCYRLLQQYSRFKERYTVQLTDDDRLVVQQRRKRWLIWSNRNKRTESVRTIEELSLEFVPQTFERYFHKFSA